MNTIATYFPQMDLRLEGIEAVGNSEGAKLGWDKRGRGQHPQAVRRGNLRFKSPAHAALHARVAGLLKNNDVAVNTMSAEEVQSHLDLMSNDVKDLPKMTAREKLKQFGFWKTVYNMVGDFYQRFDGWRHIGEALKDVAIFVAGGGLANLAVHVLPIMHHVIAMLHGVGQ